MLTTENDEPFSKIYEAKLTTYAMMKSAFLSFLSVDDIKTMLRPLVLLLFRRPTE